MYIARNRAVDFAAEYGHVQLQTKAERDAERSEFACRDWVGIMRQLDKTLTALLALPAFSPQQLSKWFKGGKDPAKRRQEMLGRFDLLVKAAQSIEQYRTLFI